MTTSEVVWLRRDLRRHDLPTLAAAAERSGSVAPVFVLDPAFWDSAGAPRRTWLARTLMALRDSYEGRLTLRLGDPEALLPELAGEFGAASVHISAETEPQGAARDAAAGTALRERGMTLVATGSPYAVTPGRIRRADGEPYQVFTPFSRAWRDHGWRAPAEEPAALRLADDRSDPSAWDVVAQAASSDEVQLPEAGEAAAQERWEWFLDEGLERYGHDRDRPDLDGTSRMSVYLKFGMVHPRTLLADLEARTGTGPERYRLELAWREFYADVLHHHPNSLWQDLRPALTHMRYDEPGAAVEAWRQGRTGFPIVDAAMRQLLGQGWMHNRLRMVVASFLIKHLHTRWQVGAGHFLDRLADADLASNQHGWQWVAGTGTDAAPYFRVFNPVLQGQKFDPNGDFVRRWVPELRPIDGPAVHEPWRTALARDLDYPTPIIDLKAERAEALARLSEARAAREAQPTEHESRS